jgi:rubrerythrin
VIDKLDTRAKGATMQIEKMTIEDILNMAAATEIQGVRFYTNLSEKVHSLPVKQKIRSLAQDEKRHLEVIEDLYRQVMGREPQAPATKGVPDIIRAIAALKIDDRTQVLQVLDMAIEGETIAAKFYHRGAALTADKKIREIFEELEREEDAHFNYLVSEKSALSGDLYWFSISDSAMMEE